MSTPQTLPLDQIDEPANPHRVGIDEASLYELADDIRAHGLLQPIVVRPREGGRYEIIAGHRRYLAHRVARLQEIAAIVREADDKEVERLRLSENLQRDQLSPMEEAAALTQLLGDAQMSVEEIAHMVRRSSDWVEKRLTLLTMPEELCRLVHERTLAINVALKLAEIDDESHRRYLLAFATEGGASYSVIREWVSAYHLAKQNNPNAEAPKPEMPAPGQPITITMPCFTCGEAHDHTQLHLVRVCAGCHQQILQNAGG